MISDYRNLDDGNEWWEPINAMAKFVEGYFRKRTAPWCQLVSMQTELAHCKCHNG